MSSKLSEKHWYDYMWIASLLYIILGFFNIIFAWLGMICFITPILISSVFGNKNYCYKYCGRGKLLQLMGEKFKLSRNKSIPAWLRSSVFRYGFMIFFMTMFMSMVYFTYKVFAGVEDVSRVVTILWTFKLPWHWVSEFGIDGWVVQYAYGFYSVMLTSTILGIVTMALYKPRSWCVYCPMGTMTQGICILKNGDEWKKKRRI